MVSKLQKWVEVRSKDRAQHEEIIWVRLLDIERVVIKQVPGGSSDWQVWVHIKDDEFKFDESKMKRESAAQEAAKLLDSIEAAGYCEQNTNTPIKENDGI